MGKDLNGKELGRGLAQEKSGLYVARFVDRYGKRQSKRFKKKQEARQWLADSQFLDESSNPLFPQQMTVDCWFEQWIEMKKTSIRLGTIDTYTSRYIKSIKPVIGDMKIVDVKPLHCHMILNRMIEEEYHSGTIKGTKNIMHILFEDARDNDIIHSNPMKRSFKCEGGKPKKEREALTEQELKLFFEGIKGHRFEIQYRLALLTGVRVGELIGIKNEDICYEKRCLYIRRTATYKYSTHNWRFGAPKSRAGRRIIPLTDEAIHLLKLQQEKNKNLKVIPIEFADYLFIDESGLIKQGAYHSALQKCICPKVGLRPLSMHILRHTLASRCVIEGKMEQSYLQKLLGHQSSITSNDYYVHVSDKQMATEIERVSYLLSAN